MVKNIGYLPQNIDRKAAYPKTIKQNNDLYLPYYVDLVNKRIDDYFNPATIEQVRAEFGKNFSFETN